MRREPTRQEQLAFALVGETLGVDVEPAEDGVTAGAVDGLILFADGRTGALEVTLVTDERTKQTEELSSELFPKDRLPGSFTKFWSVYLRASVPVSVRELERRLPAALLRCEAEGITRFRGEWHDRHLDWLSWFQEHRIRLHSFTLTSGPGIHVIVDPELGGWGSDHEGPFRDWLAATMTTNDVVVRHLAKLERQRHDERHLFLIVDYFGLHFGAFDVMSDAEMTPSTMPAVPHWLDALWIAGRFGHPLVWQRASGWRRL